jgi:shikimate kinase
VKQTKLERQIILVGLPGSGKSTVGRLLADLLHVPLKDIDGAVIKRTGMSIADIFTSHGEESFRELERAETNAALLGGPSVIVPGGGWAAYPGNLEEVTGRALTVYLETAPRTAAERVAPQGGRPMLEHRDPIGRMRLLLDERAGFYERCDVVVKTDDRTPESVAREVAELALRGYGD